MARTIRIASSNAPTHNAITKFVDFFWCVDSQRSRSWILSSSRARAGRMGQSLQTLEILKLSNRRLFQKSKLDFRRYLSTGIHRNRFVLVSPTWRPWNEIQPIGWLCSTWIDLKKIRPKAQEQIYQKICEKSVIEVLEEVRTMTLRQLLVESGLILEC